MLREIRFIYELFSRCKYVFAVTFLKLKLVLLIKRRTKKQMC